MKLYFGNIVTTITTIMLLIIPAYQHPESDWMNWSRNYNHCSYCNTDCKVTAYETDLVLCDVRRNNNEDSGNGNSEDYCIVTRQYCEE